VELDNSSDKIGAKIRRWTLQKVPYLFVVGQREVEGRTVAVRVRSVGEVGAVGLEAALQKLRGEVESRGLQPAIETAT
jgi:threonyl-tRNA synthetase